MPREEREPQRAIWILARQLSLRPPELTRELLGDPIDVPGGLGVDSESTERARPEVISASLAEEVEQPEEVALTSNWRRFSLRGAGAEAPLREQGPYVSGQRTCSARSRLEEHSARADRQGQALEALAELAQGALLLHGSEATQQAVCPS